VGAFRLQAAYPILWIGRPTPKFSFPTRRDIDRLEAEAGCLVIVTFTVGMT
jgi:hypothetical protein